MSERIVNCAKLGQELPGLGQPPYPGEMGEKIFNQISAQAWDLWLVHQTMLINEYRLSLMDLKARQFLNTEMERFLFSDEESAPPPGFTQQDS